MKKMLPVLSACMLGLTLVLGACNNPDPGNGGNGGGGGLVCSQSLPGAFAASLALAAQATPPANWDAPHVAGEVLIIQAVGLSAQAISALSGVHTQQIDAGLMLAHTPANESDADFAARLQGAGLKVQPNFLYQALAVPNDPGFPGNAGVPVGALAYDQDYLTRIKADKAWAALAAAGKANAGVLTAVLDTGVDSGHPDLAGRLLPGKTFTNKGTCLDGAADTSSDDRGHGTSSAGLIGAATNNGIGIAGLTWTGQNILPVRVFSAGGVETLDLRNGLNYAVSQGAKVINMSVGMTGNPNDAVLDSALANAAQSAVLVAAAGNTSQDGIYYPASNPNVIAVGALGKEDSLACYSARPGSASGSRQLDIVAPGGNAGTSATITTNVSGCRVNSDYDILTLTTQDRGSYTLRAGTSEAAPLVSGVASLMRAANPNLTATQVRQLLINTASGSLHMLDAEAAVKAALQ